MVFFVVEDKQMTEEADMLMWMNIVVEWKGMLGEGAVVWKTVLWKLYKVY